MGNCRLREISQFLTVCLNWLRLKCSRFACGISSSVFCLISVCSKWKEKQIMGAISYCLFPSDHHKIQQNKNEANTCFARSLCSELRLQGNWQDSGLLRLFPTLVSFPLSDLPYPQKEVLDPDFTKQTPV